MKRRFFVLAADANRTDLQSVADYDLEGFDSLLLAEGAPVKQKWSKEVRLWLDEGKRADLLGDPLSWCIVSRRLLRLLDKHGHADIESFEAPTFDESTKKRIKGYYILNVLTRISALENPAESKHNNIHNMIILANRVPTNVDLFRLDEEPSFVIMSDYLFGNLKDKGLQGVIAIKTRSK